jgi:5-formyltetrahydrofolate cyclo-ligase
MTVLDQKKRDLRQAMKRRRATAHAENPQAGTQMRDQFLRHVVLPSQSTVATTKAFGDEIDPAALTESLRAMGHVLALPVVVGRGQPLLFRRYEAGDRLAKSAFGIEEPPASAPAVEPDVLLLPLLAFDRRGHRLGHGGGFYDRTIQQLRQRKNIVAIGLAYACQEVAEVPKTTHDARLDKIVTEIHVFVTSLK